MITLHTLFLDVLSQQDVLAFIGGVKPILNAAYPNDLPVVIKQFLSTADSYIAVQQSQAVKITAAEFEACDHLADDEWRSLDYQIKSSACQHFNAEQREAAIAIQKVFSKYKDPTDMRYVKEYEVLDKLLTELEQFPAQTLKNAKVDANVIALRKRVEDFRMLYTNRIKPETEEEIGLARDVRISLNKWWEAVYAQMYADLFANEKNPAFVDAAEKLNMLIESIIEGMKG